MLLSRVGKKSKLTAHQTKTSKLTLSCSSVNIFVQEIKEKLTLESLNKRQTRRARPSSPRSTPLSLLLSSNERPISVTCQGSDCKFWTTFRSRAHGLEEQRKKKSTWPNMDNSSSVVCFGVHVLVFGVLDVGRRHDWLGIAHCRSAHAIATAEDFLIVVGRFFGFTPICP